MNSGNTHCYSAPKLSFRLHFQTHESGNRCRHHFFDKNKRFTTLTRVETIKQTHGSSSERTLYQISLLGHVQLEAFV